MMGHRLEYVRDRRPVGGEKLKGWIVKLYVWRYLLREKNSCSENIYGNMK